MRSIISDLIVGMLAGFIGEPTDGLIMDTHTPMAVMEATEEDIILTPMEAIIRTGMGLIVGTCVEFIVVHIEGAITDTPRAALWRPVL